MTRALGSALFVAILLLALQTWRLDRVRADYQRVKSEAALLAARLDDAEKDAQTVADQCVLREENARKSARAIERIVTREVHVDPDSGCPVAGLIGAGELSDAITPGTPAKPLHNGQEGPADPQ